MSLVRNHFPRVSLLLVHFENTPDANENSAFMDTSLSEADDPTMETVEDAEELNSRANISAVPEEILELIFGYLSPYGDMKNVMLVCKQWYRVVSGMDLESKEKLGERC